ncbi:MAG: hypothetical protein AAFU61_00105 [Pseudomonadota bacterium]
MYYEDELIKFSLTNLVPIVDFNMINPRLNVLLPSLSASGAFGGLATQVDLPLQVFEHSLVDRGWKLRFICTGPAPLPEDNIVNRWIERRGLDPAPVACHYNSGSGAPVPVARGDLFMGSLWFNMSWALPLMRFQQSQFGGSKRPYISMVQDYEAGFHPWSSAYMLATAAYDNEWPKRVIFNSTELAAFYKARGHTSEASFTFEPVLNAALREALADPSSPKKERRILLYGRPKSRRNCFFLAKRALELWAERYENAHAWRIVSVGAAYPPFALSGAVPVDVLGKLTLLQYADELHRAAVGLSLMASPHPSYPPLEMAHFGALTICNNFECKDMTAWHDNLSPVAVPDPEHLAEALTMACRRFDADPAVGLVGRTRKPLYLKETDTAVLDGIAQIVTHEIS